MVMAGQIYDRRAEAIHDPLTARALVLDNGAPRVAKVAWDLIAPKRWTVFKARELVAASYTHTGPRVTDLFPLPPAWTLVRTAR